MGKLIDLTNKDFGSWTVLKRLDSRILNCGTAVIFWDVLCNNCGHKFDVSGKSLRRRRPPQFCINCTPKKSSSRSRPKNNHNLRGYSSLILHHVDVECSSRALYPALTDDKDKVTCIKCKRILFRESNKAEEDELYHCNACNGKFNEFKMKAIYSNKTKSGRCFECYNIYYTQWRLSKTAKTYPQRISKCNKCNRLFNRFHPRTDLGARTECPYCDSKDIKRGI